MKTTLRVVAIFLGFFVFRLALSIVQDSSSGQLAVWWRSGHIRSETLCFWAVMLILGPVATVQMWRLRRIGVSAAALLGALSFFLAVYGLLHRRTDEPFEPFVPTLLLSGALLALAVSPAAKRACSDSTGVAGSGASRVREPDRNL